VTKAVETEEAKNKAYQMKKLAKKAQELGARVTVDGIPI
jgi:hypothetical protein